MATGQGAAVGIDLYTKAKVTLTREPGRIVCHNLSDPHEDPLLAHTVVNMIFRRFNVHRTYGAVVETASKIPVAVGLKSSSAASNAIVLATLDALDRRVSDLHAVRLGVEASLEAGVTITGAFDDACACFFGGIFVTNNRTLRVVKQFKPPQNLIVLIYVPKTKQYTKNVDVSRLQKVKPLIDLAFLEALKGNYWPALTINGLTCAEAFGQDTTPIKDAMSSGAVASGLTGKGPAIVAIVKKSSLKPVLNAWRRLPGRTIQASFNYQAASSVSVRG
jgi:shikimate kinase